MANNPVKYQVLIEQDLRSILDISVVLPWGVSRPDFLFPHVPPLIPCRSSVETSVDRRADFQIRPIPVGKLDAFSASSALCDLTICVVSPMLIF